MYILQSQGDNATIYFIFSLMLYSSLLNDIPFFFIIETYCLNCANFLSDINGFKRQSEFRIFLVGLCTKNMEK